MGGGEAGAPGEGDGAGAPGAGDAPGGGDGGGGGEGSTGMVQVSSTPVGLSCAVSVGGAGGVGCTTSVTILPITDTCPRCTARAASLMGVPTGGSGNVSTTRSPGPALKRCFLPALSSSPGPSRRSSSSSSTPRRSPPVVRRGAIMATSRTLARWATVKPVTACGVRGSGGSGSPRLPHALSPDTSTPNTSAQGKRASERLGGEA